MLESNMYTYSDRGSYLPVPLENYELDSGIQTKEDYLTELHIASMMMFGRRLTAFAVLSTASQETLVTLPGCG